MPKLERILLIDDDSTVNYINERLIRNLDVAKEVMVLTNGEQALEYIIQHCGVMRKNCPELIVLDHHMPVMDGMELLKNLQQLGILENMKSIFLLLAAHSSKQDIEAFEEMGVQEFTDKPLSKETLLDAYHKYWADDTVRDHTPDKE